MKSGGSRVHPPQSKNVEVVLEIDETSGNEGVDGEISILQIMRKLIQIYE